jgi:hypothetical protein
MIKYFNTALSWNVIAQAYRDNDNYNSKCFLLWKGLEYLPKGIKIMGAKLVNGNLKVEYENNTPYTANFFIKDGELYLKLTEGGTVMALVDLGNVVGPKGDTGEQGPKGDTGAQGPQGAAGITPTFVLGDGTGGTTAGHLYADYDNPYTPS